MGVRILSDHQKTFDPKCHELAALFMDDNREAFPANQYDALVNALASEIQSTIEDFIEYPDLSLKFLAEAEERAANR